MNTLTQLLEKKNSDVIVNAMEAVRDSRLRHNGVERPDKTQQLLKKLYSLTLQCIAEKNVTLMIEFVRRIPYDRFLHSYDIYEVQLMFNILEEAIWDRILKELSPIDYANALGQISTVLGIGKDTMARSYVSLASKKLTPYIDYKILFEGMDSE